MTLSHHKIKLTFDYITVAFICIVIILSPNGKYITAFLCTAIHESGHIAAMLALGSDNISININLFNISIRDTMRSHRPYKEDILIILAGPAFNIISVILFGLLYMAVPADIVYDIVIISALLAVFNLLPLESTDGGQLLTIALGLFFSKRTVDIVVTVISLILIIPIATAGFLVLLSSKYNYTLLFAAVYIMLISILKKAK